MSAVSAPQGNPAVVGLAGFGLTTLVLQFHNVGWMPSLGPVIWLGLVFGGFTQLVAGFMEKSVGNNFGFCAFTGYGCFWISLCLMLIGNSQGWFVAGPEDVGFFLIAWTLFTLILWVGSMAINGALATVFTILVAGFLLLDIAHFVPAEDRKAWTVAAGYVLMPCALGAWYIMAHNIYKDLFGRDILPVGAPWISAKPATQAEPSLDGALPA
ncbi:MAG: acetate uptake transporter [Planctomycetota bacterium]|jgi:succinate-acetate transporter protein|nr:acetate uptake transporter [Planctomycetota bacterium]